MPLYRVGMLFENGQAGFGRLHRKAHAEGIARFVQAHASGVRRTWVENAFVRPFVDLIGPLWDFIDDLADQYGTYEYRYVVDSWELDVGPFTILKEVVDDLSDVELQFCGEPLFHGNVHDTGGSVWILGRRWTWGYG